MNNNDRWGTPPEIIEIVKEILGVIDLDPASEPAFRKQVGATKFYTAKNDGLKWPWCGRVWCNPPYSAKLLKHFTKKFFDEFDKGLMEQGLMLTNSGTDTIWNIPLSKGIQAYTIGRISFLQPDGSRKATGSRGQCLTYLGDAEGIKHFVEVIQSTDRFWIPNLQLLDL